MILQIVTALNWNCEIAIAKNCDSLLQILRRQIRLQIATACNCDTATEIRATNCNCLLLRYSNWNCVKFSLQQLRQRGKLRRSIRLQIATSCNCDCLLATFNSKIATTNKITNFDCLQFATASFQFAILINCDCLQLRYSNSNCVNFWLQQLLLAIAT